MFIKDNPPGCPSLAFTFGYFQQGITDPTNVTSMICFQKMQEDKSSAAGPHPILMAGPDSTLRRWLKRNSLFAAKSSGLELN